MKGNGDSTKGDAMPDLAAQPKVADAADFDANGALTREFLLGRGFCCREGCSNCPYGFDPAA